jgi:signal transduction histidine kinase
MRNLCRAAIEETELAHGQRTIAFDGAGDFDGTWDVDRVMQEVSNLLGNALVHGHDPVEVVLRSEADSVVLQVRNGGSIPVAILPHIFEPFRAAAREEMSTRSGLGLGLYVVKEIVDAHGGTIRVSSTERDGTIFTVRWPRIVSTPSTAHGGAR